MDDFAACADFCEEYGFPGPAGALRALGEGRGRFYFVRSLMPPEDAAFFGFDVGDIAPAGRKVFLDPAAAERLARRLTTRALRNFAPVETYTRNPSRLPDADYCREVGAILGVDYRLPERPGDRAFPEWATDEHLLGIAQLLNAPLFDVAEVGYGPGRAVGTWLATAVADDEPDGPPAPEA